MAEWDMVVSAWDVVSHNNERTSIRFTETDIKNQNHTQTKLVELKDADIPKLIGALSRYAKSINA